MINQPPAIALSHPVEDAHEKYLHPGFRPQGANLHVRQHGYLATDAGACRSVRCRSGHVWRTHKDRFAQKPDCGGESSELVLLTRHCPMDNPPTSK